MPRPNPACMTSPVGSGPLGPGMKPGPSVTKAGYHAGLLPCEKIFRSVMERPGFMAACRLFYSAERI